MSRATAVVKAFEALQDEDKRIVTDEVLRRAVPVEPARRDDSDRWLQTHQGEFMGKWVALKGGEFIAAGENGKAVYDQARAAGVDCPLLLHLTPREHPSGGL